MLNGLKQNAVNTLGWRTKRKIVVFESDDWGMIRTHSKSAYQMLKRKGYPVEGCVYNCYDSLERNEDVSGLLVVLANYKGADNRPAKFTINNVVTNPEFDKIKQRDFQEYFYKPFTETYDDYNSSENVMNLYQQGLKDGLIQIQFHGREHVNINRWLEALQAGDRRFLDAFDQNQYTVAGQGRTSGRRDYLDAFGRAYSTEYESEKSIVHSGLKLFEQIWGFKSQSFIAPCYTWSSVIEEYLAKGGVKYLQGTHVQRIPKPGLELKIGKKYHWQGKKNASGLKSIVRNVMFEPAENNSHPSTVDKAMIEIKNAFFWKKPAVISSHRVNYIGRLQPQNRSKNLKLLEELLSRIIEEYPDVVFMSSDDLGELYDK